MMTTGDPTRMPLTLALQRVPRERVDMSPITPSALAQTSARDVAGIELRAGNRRWRVGELFDVSGEDVARVLIRNSCERLIRIGGGMRFGEVSVEGDAGIYAGAAMAGGTLRIHGNAAAFAASAMEDGLLHVRGSAGDFLGAAVAGEAAGMSGGTALVEGNAGDRSGDRMRRGTILIGRDAGDYCASRMVAGTIIVRGRTGSGAGFGMRRGTLLATAVTALPATFADGGPPPLIYLRLLQRYLLRSCEAFAPFGHWPEALRRSIGDRSCGGLGEILVAT